MKKTINFSDKYYKKLDPNQRLIPTIRSINYMKNHKMEYGDRIKITVNREYLCDAFLIGYIDKKINEIPLNFLKYDTKIKNIDDRINNHQDFSDILNSFLRKELRGFAPNRPTTKKRIIFLFRID